MYFDPVESKCKFRNCTNVETIHESALCKFEAHEFPAVGDVKVEGETCNEYRSCVRFSEGRPEGILGNSPRGSKDEVSDGDSSIWQICSFYCETFLDNNNQTHLKVFSKGECYKPADYGGICGPARMKVP